MLRKSDGCPNFERFICGKIVEGVVLKEDLRSEDICLAIK